MHNPSTLLPTRRTNPCDVCGDTEGKCKAATDGLLKCWNKKDGSAPDGWRFDGLSSNSTHGKFYANPGAVSPAAQQLQALGYTEADRVFYRAINSTGARKIEGTGLLIPAQVQQSSDAGYNLYLVVNGGGHADADVIAGRAAFYEHDNLEKSIQVDLWRSLDLPEPTFQVDTGGKSIHSYWVFEEPIAIGLWRTLQADLLAYSDGDRSIKNPSRVMRLAGFKHQKTGQTASIISNSGQRYSYETVRASIPAPATVETPQRSIETAQSIGDVPLLVCLALSIRDLIRDGAGEGSRNDAGAKVARDLIGTAAELRDMGVRFDGDPRSLFDDYCRNCSPAIDDREADQIWRSAEASNPGASLSPDKIKGCVAGWEKRQQRPVNAALRIAAGGAVAAIGVEVQLNQAETPAEATYEQAIKDLAARGYIPADALHFAQSEIAETHRKNVLDVKAAYAAVSSVQAETEALGDRKESIDRYLELTQSRIDLSTILPAPFVAVLEELGDLLGSTPEVMTQTTLSAVASLCQIGTQLMLGRSGYYAKPILWTANIIPSGGNKSGTQRTVLSPLEAMQGDEMKRFEGESKAYKRALTQWKQKGEGEEPEEPAPVRRYILKRATKEAVIQIQCQQPERGLLVFRDELSGWFNSMSSSSKKNSDDLDFWCEVKNGDSLIDNTKSSGNGYCQASSISVTGGTQPQTMQNLMGDFSDGQGLWARFLPCFTAYKRRARPSMTGPQISIFEWLKSAYQLIDGLPVVTYLMEPEAYEVWANYSDYLKDAIEAESRDALRSVYSKAESESGTLIMLLHILKAALLGETPSYDIPRATAEGGVALSKFFIAQVHQLHRLGDEKAGDLDAVLAKIIDKSTTLGGRITWKQARDLRALYVPDRSGIPKRPTRTVVNGHFARLQEMGYGSIDGDGDNFGFTIKMLKSAQSAQKCSTSGSALTTTAIGLEGESAQSAQKNLSLPREYEVAYEKEFEYIPEA
jgi:Protein of unknown function (DUF3987)